MGLIKESYKEGSLKKDIEALGGLYIKLPGFLLFGIPDRILLGPNKTVIFFEAKRTKHDEPRKLQKIRHRELRGFGFNVMVTDNPREVLEEFKKRTQGGNKKTN